MIIIILLIWFLLVCIFVIGGLSGWAISMIVISSVFVFGAFVLILSRVCSSSKQRRSRRTTTQHDAGQTNTAYTIGGGDITVTSTAMQPGYQSGGQPYPPQMVYPNAPPPSYSAIAGTTPYPPAAGTTPYPPAAGTTPYPPAAGTAPLSEPQGAFYNPTAAYPPPQPEITNQAAAAAGPPVQQGDGTAANEKKETVALK